MSDPENTNIYLKNNDVKNNDTQTMSKYRGNISMISGRFDVFVYNIKIICVQMSSACINYQQKRKCNYKY